MSSATQAVIDQALQDRALGQFVRETQMRFLLVAASDGDLFERLCAHLRRDPVEALQSLRAGLVAELARRKAAKVE